jgi:hypothetical protein
MGGYPDLLNYLLGRMDRTADQSETSRWRRQFGSVLVMVALFGACYMLSLGPLLRYSGTTSTYTDPWGNKYTVRTPSGWVRTLYQPMFHVIEQEPGSSSGKHGLARAYRNYLEWWQAKP